MDRLCILLQSLPKGTYHIDCIWSWWKINRFCPFFFNGKEKIPCEFSAVFYYGYVHELLEWNHPSKNTYKHNELIIRRVNCVSFIMVFLDKWHAFGRCQWCPHCNWVNRIAKVLFSSNLVNSIEFTMLTRDWWATCIIYYEKQVLSIHI